MYRVMQDSARLKWIDDKDSGRRAVASLSEYDPVQRGQWRTCASWPKLAASKSALREYIYEAAAHPMTLIFSECDRFSKVVDEVWPGSS
jgi:hypothetical protein